jgi:hypothetical protein
VRYRVGLGWWLVECVVALAAAALSAIAMHLIGIDGTIGWMSWSWACVFWLRAHNAAKAHMDIARTQRVSLVQLRAENAALRASAAVRAAVRRHQ